MPKDKVLTPAQAARLKMTVLRNNLRASYPAPHVSNVLPAIPGDNVEKLPLDLQGEEVQVEIIGLVLDPGPNPGDVGICLTRDEVPVSPLVELPIPPPAAFGLNLPGSETLTPRYYNLGYQTQYFTSVTNSASNTFVIDNVSPNHGVKALAPRLPADLGGNIITQAYLADKGGVVLTLPSPNDRRTGDIAHVFLGASIPGRKVAQWIAPDSTISTITVRIERDEFELIGEGDKIIYYRWEDRVGNQGPESYHTDVVVQLSPSPSNLQPPLVVENDDGLIDTEDAYPDVAVTIDVFDNGLPGDQAEVRWDGFVQRRVDTDGTTPVIVDVPFANIATHGPGPRDVRVTYAIVRNGVSFNEPTGKTVSIDLTVPGPENPDPDPDPEIGNPRLVPVVVKGAVSPDNQLREADIGSTVTAKVVIIPEGVSGDIVQLYWNNVPVPGVNGQYIVTGTEDPLDLMEFEIPWTMIDATRNNNRLPVHYVVTNTGSPNPNPSLRQFVDVYIFPVTLPKPEVQYLFTNPFGQVSLACSSLRDIPEAGGLVAVVRVTIDPADPNPVLEEGTVLNFLWKGVGYPEGTKPPVPDYPLPPKTLTAEEAAGGFVVYLPFTAALKPIRDGRGDISYTAQIHGRTETSDSHVVRVVVLRNSTTFCDGTPGI